MNTDNTTHNPGADWQTLGDLELSVGASVEDALYAWLTEIIHPLGLQAEMLNKIILSAQEAVSRAKQSEVVLQLQWFHLTVFVPFQWETKEQAWGFFRLEKFEDAKDGQAGGDHTIEFYLYREGE